MLALSLTSLFMLLLPFVACSYIWHLSITTLFLMTIYSIMFIFPASAFTTFYTASLFIDFLSLPLVSLTLWISALMILASYLTLFKKTSPSIFLLSILSLNSILILTFSFSNLILLYIFFEASLIPTLFLILGWGYQPERLQAGFYLIIYTVAASLPLMMNLLLIYFMNKSISLMNYFWLPSTTSSMFFIWWLTLILAFLVKMPLYMFHLWLPKAHVEAPIAGSMILAGILLKLGSYGLIRLASLFSHINTLLLPLIGALAMWGAVLTSMICTRQPDMKSLIAYSSVGHMGLLTAGAMTSTSWGWEGSLLMMTAHGLCSSALFAIANFTYETTHTRSIFLTKGLLTLFPAMSIIWFLLSAANMAAPPTLNLISEIILLSSVLSSSMIMSLTIAALSFLAAVYSLFLFTATQHGQLSNFMSPLNMFSTRYTMLLYFHMIPLFLLTLKTDFILNWSLF